MYLTGAYVFGLPAPDADALFAPILESADMLATEQLIFFHLQNQQISFRFGQAFQPD
jgi:hypothetical protein